MELVWKVEWKNFPRYKWDGKGLEWEMERKWTTKSSFMIGGMEITGMESGVGWNGIYYE